MVFPSPMGKPWENFNIFMFQERIVSGFSNCGKAVVLKYYLYPVMFLLCMLSNGIQVQDITFGMCKKKRGGLGVGLPAWERVG